MRYRLSVGAVCGALLLSACVTPQKPLSEIKPNFPSIDVAMANGQEEIFINRGQAYQTPAYYYVPAGTSPAAAAAGGAIAFLIIAGIESAEAADAKRDAAPLNEALSDFDYKATLQREFEAALSEFSWTRVGEFAVLEDASPKGMNDMLAQSEQSGLLVVGANYYLSNTANAVIVSGHAFLHPKPDPARDAKRMNPRRAPPPAVYSVSVSYEMPSLAQGARRADHIPYWAANDAAALHEALNNGAAKVAAMLKQTLEEGTEPFKTVRGESVEKRQILAYNGLKVKVRVLESGPDGELVRVQDGSLRFLARPSTPAVPQQETPEEAPDETPEGLPVETQTAPSPDA